MTNFHPQFPFGKGMWIHDIGAAADLKKDSFGELAVLSKFDANGNALYKAGFNDIIKKLTDNNFTYVLIKTADGDGLYPDGNSQLTKDMVDACHAAGLKVYSWSYVYGSDPVKEGDMVLYCFDQLGVDGHVFDAEIEWEKLPNPAAAAEQMLQTVRAKYPNAFLAHAPFPIIDYHTAFPYQMFGKYCDAVMPQMYWNDIGIDVQTMIADTYNQWSKWQDNWTASGHGDSVKPIIPLGMSWDLNEKTPPVIMTPAQLTDFISGVAGYLSVNFWYMEGTVRDDLWTALKDTPVKPKPADETAQTINQNGGSTQSSTPAPATPASDNTNQQAPATQTPSQPAQTQPATPAVTPGSTATTPSTVVPPAQPASNGATVAKSQPFTPPATVTVKEDKTSPSGMKVVVTEHKPHIDYVIEFFTYIFHTLIPGLFGKKGGEGK